MTQIYNRPFVPPLHERPPSYENKPHLLVPQTQDSHPVFSTSQYEGTGWKGSRPLSPMSDHRNYDIPPRGGDMYQSRQDGQQKPPREQLPPFTSLFGTASSQKSGQSPYSDRPSPIYPSPSDPRQPSAPIYLDRPYDPAYYQRPPISREYSYGSRQDHPERHYIQPPPRPAQHGVGPESPRYEPSSRPSPVEIGRHQGPSSTNGWSPLSQSNRSEYFSRDTSSSFRHVDQQHSAHRQEPENRQIYRGPPTLPNFSSTSTTIGGGELPTIKDGLGPKIWTGTQFLPRFVRSAEVPGEGMCYFYDDGTHCKTVIDGEIVNAHWGVTKAGKPRKRLAIACITCREKKIKCDPDFPRCTQCEKFGRVCKFKNAPRGGQGSPDTPPGDLDDQIARPTSSSRTDAESHQSEKREHSHPLSPGLVLQTGMLDEDKHSSKRQRTGYTDFTRLTPVASEASPRPSVQEAPSPSTPRMDPLIPAPIERSVLVEWQTNPFATQPELVTELVEVFFKYVPETAHCILPEKLFKVWVLSHSQKSVDDLMLIYTILALATVFSPKAEHRPLGGQFAAISRHACDSRHFTLQLIQSRLLLSLYYFAINNPNDAWDFCGSALRAASGLKLNLEMEKTDDAFRQTYPYGLNRIGYAECRRRTFWSAYIIDRFNGFCSGHLCIIHPEDVFLRLPCTTDLFESQAKIQTPFFDLTTPPISSADRTVGPMAYLINVSTIWGHVMANIYRMSQRPTPLATNTEFLTHYDTMTRRLREWKESLPSNLAFSPENMMKAADAGRIPTYIMMHAVYHTTTIKLNRYIQKSVFSPAQLAHHVSVAKQFARSLLNVLDILAATKSASDRRTPVKFSSPFVGYSIIAVVDVLSASFPLSSVHELLVSFDGAQTILGELATFWQSGRHQNGMVQQRIKLLNELAAARDDPSKSDFKFSIGRDGLDGLFELKDSIEQTFARDFDCFYV